MCLFLLSVLFHDFPVMHLFIENYKWILSIAKPSWQPLRASSCSLFFRKQITKSALGWGVLKLEVSLCEVSSWFWGKSLCRAPHWACLSPLSLLTSHSNLRTQGSQNLCWEPRLNTQLLILLTVANRVPSEAQRPETTPEEKAVTGSLLCLPLFWTWHQLFDFLPVPGDC